MNALPYKLEQAINPQPDLRLHLLDPPVAFHKKRNFANITAMGARIDLTLDLRSRTAYLGAIAVSILA